MQHYLIYKLIRAIHKSEKTSSFQDLIFRDGSTFSIDRSENWDPEKLSELYDFKTMKLKERFAERQWGVVRSKDLEIRGTWLLPLQAVWLWRSCLNLFKFTFLICEMRWLYLYCYGLFVPPPNSYIDILTLNVTVLRGGAFGRSLGHEGGALMDGIRDLSGHPRKLTRPLHRVRIQQEVRSLQPGRGSSQDLTVILGFPATRMGEINCCCF